jgi:DeoR/GlpR family transcriptional regulator of sugar metabolism
MLTAMAEQKMLNVVGKLAVLVDSSKVGERAPEALHATTAFFLRHL